MFVSVRRGRCSMRMNWAGSLRGGARRVRQLGSVEAGFGVVRVAAAG